MADPPDRLLVVWDEGRPHELWRFPGRPPAIGGSLRDEPDASRELRPRDGPQQGAIPDAAGGLEHAGRPAGNQHGRLRQRHLQRTLRPIVERRSVRHRAQPVDERLDALARV